MTDKSEKQSIEIESVLESSETGPTADPSLGRTSEDRPGPAGAEVSAAMDDAERWKQRAAQADANWDRVVRLTADLDNLRKRAARERQEAVRFANESLLEKLLPTLDSFEMALAAAHNAGDASIESFRTGIAMVHDQLRTVLADAGLEEIEATGQPFDPRWHEAVSQMDSAEVPEGRVLQQLRKGYKLRDRLIRPATVVVSKGPGT